MHAPTGHVAFLFTDVAGSSTAWERFGEAFRAALDQHDALLRAAIAAHGGYEVKTEGDSFMAAFPSALAALEAAAEAQDALEAAALPGALGPLRVRMGVHVGPVLSRPDPVSGRMDYFGPTVNKAARIAAGALPGQVLLSDEAAEGLTLPARDLGLYSLRGLSGLHRIWQLGLDSLGAPRLPRERRSNLPERLDSFFGRDAELALLTRLFESGARCVTLHGPGGAGKTRLSLQWAARALDGLADGAWFCDLSAARDHTAVLSAVARALELPLGRDPEVQLAEALAGRGRVLLLLDNAEQVVGPLAALVERWLQRAPSLLVLSTSRLPLGLRAERLLPIHPLDPAQAVRLFQDRARQPGDPQDIAELVARLDHLPLAIELAAARTRSMSPRQILDRVDQRFRLLSGGPTDLPRRHSTLRAALDWSWDLLGAEERSALVQLCAFEGGFALEAAEGVRYLEGWAPDLVQRLVDHSLLRLDPEIGRYTAMASVVAYAQAQDPETAAAAERRHGAWFARLGAVDQPSALSELGGQTLRVAALPDLPNLLAAARRALDREDGAVAAGNVLALAWLLEQVGPLHLGAELIDRALRLESPEPLQTALHTARAMVAQRTGDLERLNVEVQLALRGAVASGRMREESAILRIWGAYLLDQSRLEEASAAAARAAALGRSLGHPAAIAASLNLGGQISRHRSLLSEAQAQLDEALALARQIDDRRLQAQILSSLAMLAQEQEGAPAAEARLREAIVLCIQTGDLGLEAVNTGNLGNLLLDLGRLDEALPLMERAILLFRRMGHARYVVTMRGNLGNLCSALDQPERAEQLLREALDAQRALGRQLEMAISLISLGVHHARAGRWEEAEAELREAIARSEGIGFTRGVGAALHRLAQVLLRRGALDEAEASLERAWPLVQASGDRFEQGMILAVQAQLSHARGDEAGAREMLEQGRALAERIGAGTRSELGRALRRGGEVLEAAEPAP